MSRDLVVFYCADCGYMLEVISTGKKGTVCESESYARTCSKVNAELTCCGKPMELLTTNSVEASQEKHIPVITTREDCWITVQVGSVVHPMTDEHLIKWIAVVTDSRVQRINLMAEDKPLAVFCIGDAHKVKASVYAYCNLHGLWKAEL